MIYHDRVTITGNDTGYSKPASGLLEMIKVDYSADSHANTDVVITDEATGLSLYSKANSKTDVELLVRGQIADTGGTLQSAYDRLPLTGRVKIVVTDNTSTETVTVDLWWSE